MTDHPEAERIALPALAIKGIKDARERLGFSLRDVEEITNGAISNPYLSQLENGKIKSPSLQIAVSLAAAYAVPLELIAEWLSLEAACEPTRICPECGHAVRTILQERS